MNPVDIAASATDWTADQQRELREAVLPLTLGGLRQVVRYAMNQTLDNLVNCQARFEDVVFDWLEVVQRGGWHETFVRAVYSYRPQDALILAFCRAHAPYVFVPTSQQQAVNAAVRISELAGPVGMPGGEVVRDSVQHAAAAASDTLGRIDLMGRYKQIHELLHALDYGLAYELTRSVGMLRVDPQRFRSTVTEVRQFRRYCDQLDEQTAILVRVVGSLPEREREGEAIWVEHVSLAATSLRAASGPNGDPVAADDGLQLLLDTLAQRPMRINGRIVELARGVDLPDLAAHLGVVVTALPPDEPLAGPLTEALGDLGGLGSKVTALVAEHDSWQQLDNPLGMVARTPSQLRIMWTQIRKLGERLVAAYPDRQWAIELTAAVSRYVGATLPDDREFAFDDFRQIAGRRFRAVDAELLELATALRHIASQVQTVSGVIGNVNN